MVDSTLPQSDQSTVTINGSPVRQIQNGDGKAWFSLVDLCAAFNLKNPTLAFRTRAIDLDGKVRIRVADGYGTRKQLTTFISKANRDALEIPRQRIPRIGERFGRLIVTDGPHHRNHGDQRHAFYTCKCDCGKTKEILGYILVRPTNPTRSCGCIKLEVNVPAANLANTRHGASRERLYHIWANMRQRCSEPSHISYKNYGGRSISVCEEWAIDFSAFAAWAHANGYEDHLTIDRRDNDGNYEPSNCRWVTQAVNNQNRPRGG